MALAEEKVMVVRKGGNKVSQPSFVGWAIDRVDPSARGAYALLAAARGGGFAAVAVRYPSLATPATNPRLRETLMLREHRRAHRLIWTAIAIIVPCVLVLGFLAGPIARFPEPQRLAAAAGGGGQ